MPENGRPLCCRRRGAGEGDGSAPLVGAVDVAAAQFMFIVDAFIVNVAIATIRADLRVGAAEIEAVIAVYLIAYATLVIIGGRLGDLHGVKTVFLSGLIGSTLASVCCGLARSSRPQGYDDDRGTALSEPVSRRLATKTPPVYARCACLAKSATLSL